MSIKFNWPEHFIRQRDEWISSTVDCVTSDAETFTESPIEAMFLAALFFNGGFDCDPVTIVNNEGHIGGRSTPGWVVYPQRKIGNCRVDFWILASNYGVSKSIVVECDGHDFHEKTKEQATKDKARDRRLQSLGHMVYRFTGSEIYKDALQTVSDFTSDIDQLLYHEMEHLRQVAGSKARNPDK